MKKIENIITDLDGTLLNDEGTIGEITKKYLAYLDKKIDIILISGRTIGQILPFVKELKIATNEKPYIIGLGGNLLFNVNSKRYKYFKKFNSDDVLSILKSNIFLNKPIYGYSARTKYIFKDKVNLKEYIKNFLRFCMRKKCYVVKKTSPRKNLLKLQSFVSATDSKINLLRCNANVFINKNEIEILPIGVNKMTAISYLSLKKDNCIYFGDSDNDVPCLSFFELSVALSNASSIAKDASKIVLNKTNNEDAVIKFLKEEHYFDCK